MGAWSGEPFGNDEAADFAYQLDETRRWTAVKSALRDALRSKAPLDADTAVIAIAAAEVVAHGLGRPTQSDVYTESVESFVSRARRPSARLARDAARAVDAAASPNSELAELWEEEDAPEWREAVTRLKSALVVS